MSYYNPNYYLNYPTYGATANQQIPQTPQPQMQPIPQQQNVGINGKIVDSEDIVKATEVPIGGYGVFPKADLSEIYIKTWNNNGTTSILTQKPQIPPKEETQTAIVAPKEETTDKILERLNILENKIDNILVNNSNNNVTPKKEVDVSAY